VTTTWRAGVAETDTGAAADTRAATSRKQRGKSASRLRNSVSDDGSFDKSLLRRSCPFARSLRGVKYHRLNAPVLEARYATSHRVYECAGIAIGSASALALGWHLTQGPAASLTAWLPAVVLGMLEADLLSGVVHWVFDTWGSSRTPLVGPLAIRTFREHHDDAHAMLAHDFVETNGHNFALSAVLSGVGWLASAPLFARAFLVAAVFVALTSQIHKWAHTKRPPALVCALQRWRVILSPAHHQVHHQDRHTRNYCITTGWLDAPLRALRVWEGLEVIFPRFGGRSDYAANAAICDLNSNSIGLT
jgi:ubiquitin-conjugating enzyme E2 variant